MTIERINVPDPISKYNKVDNTTKTKKTVDKDSINLSEEAKLKAEVYNATELAKSSPAVRKDRVEEVKKKLEDPSYINDRVIEAVAEEIMKYFEI
jgi:negative regulator of flagellin synthesis FlgM